MVEGDDVTKWRKNKVYEIANDYCDILVFKNVVLIFVYNNLVL